MLNAGTANTCVLLLYSSQMQSTDVSQGFPSDGPNKTTKAYDYYATSFAIPFYTLLYAKLCAESDPDRAALYRKRALANLPNVVQLFAPDGASIAFGRSMTYRFATSCFWAAVAFSELEVGNTCSALHFHLLTLRQLPAPFTLGVVKGLLLRNIRWFTQKPECFARDGSLTIGWTTPNQFMSEVSLHRLLQLWWCVAEIGVRCRTTTRLNHHTGLSSPSSCSPFLNHIHSGKPRKSRTLSPTSINHGQW